MAEPRPAAEEYIAARLNRLRTALVQAKLPALLVTNFKDVSYLTGFEGDDSYALITPDQAMLISDFRYEEQIAREAPWVDVAIRKKGINDETVRQIKRLKLPKVAVQSESMTLRNRAALERELKERGAKTTLLPVDEIIIKLRHIKDAREIEILERAITIAEHGFEAMKAHLKVGTTENEVASQLTHEMRKRGALNSSFDSIVAAGPNGSLPHYRPGQVKIRENSALLVDWGALVGGYCSDLTRVIFIGSVPPEIKEIYHIVLEAQLAAIAAIKPGISGKQVDKVAHDIIAKAGYGDKFGHGLGHGIGRDIHEAISFSRLSTTKLVEGMVLTVEPGIYLPGIGGVRIEDDVLVTATDCRVLSHLAKSMESCRM